MEDLLIDYGWENLVFILSGLLFVGIVLVAGFVSRNLENALVFTTLATVPLFLWFIFSHLP